MKINHLSAESFMLFDSIDMQFSDNINVIFGENSTGKTALIKTLYSAGKLLADNSDKKEDQERFLLHKLIGVFQPDKSSIGRLVARQQGGGKAKVVVSFDKSNQIDFSFGYKQTNHLTVDVDRTEKDDFIPIFLPPKEIISSTGNFTSLYDDYHIEFDETYYDLARLLLRPLKKGKNTDEQNAILSNFSNIMNGSVIQRNNRFFLNVKGAGEFEMGLVSEGFRKLSTLTYLILSGSLNKKSILFWDEPETNMNPKMIYHVANSLAELSRMGVQVFITTHSYFIQQAFNLMSCYPSKEKEPVKINFISLYRDEKDKVTYESADCLADIQHNAIMEEFDSLYDREQDLMT